MELTFLNLSLIFLVIEVFLKHLELSVCNNNKSPVLSTLQNVILMEKWHMETERTISPPTQCYPSACHPKTMYGCHKNKTNKHQQLTSAAEKMRRKILSFQKLITVFLGLSDVSSD